VRLTGSSASYFEQGEYVMGAEPELLRPVKGALLALRRFWRETLGMGSEMEAVQHEQSLFVVPFIDYARGDGRSIGPGQDEEWAPELISDELGWVDNYRGLWGLDTHDPLGGERAPAGPKYARDGTVRESWYDPVGWAGLDKVFPPGDLPDEIAGQLAEVQAELQTLEEETLEKREAVRRMALEVEALRMAEHTSALHKNKEDALDEEQKALQALQSRRIELVETQQALQSYQRRVEQGDEGPPTAHLRHVHHPEPPLHTQHRSVEVWAALSNALVLLSILLVVIFQPEHWFVLLIGLGVIFGGIEATTRRRLTDYLLTIIIILAVVAGIILVVEFWRWIVVLALIGIMVYSIWDSLRELGRQ
jgi:hypothetical protein